MFSVYNYALYRQQREEIMRKQEKLESMLKKKKEARPESPGGRRKRVKRPSIVPRRFHSNRSSEVSQTNKKMH